MNRQQVQLAEFAYPTVAKDAVLSSPDASKQLLVHSVSAYNSTANSIDVGVGLRYATGAWKIYQVNASYTDLTSVIQAGTSSIVLPTTNNYGFIVQCKNIFSLLSLTVSQIETGSPVYSYQYWNGSAWATLNLRNSFVYTSAASIGIAFAPPLDWAQGNGSVIADLASGAGYCIRVRGTTAPSQAVKISALSVSRFWMYRQISSKAHLTVSFDEQPALLEVGESVQAFFATAANNNSAEVEYRVNG